MRPREPHWQPKIIESYPQGQPANVIFYEENEKPVKQVIFYPEGQIKIETDLTWVEKDSPGYQEWKTNAVPHGAYVSFYANGGVEKFAFYEHGILHGDAKAYYSDGKIQGIGTFVKGAKDGHIVAYHEDGTKAEESDYKNGKLVGDLIRYYPKDVRSALIPYEDGLPHGNALEWYPSGALKASYRYSHGLLNSEGKNPAVLIYNENREIAEVQDFKQGEPIGVHLKYHPNGKESYRMQYKNGQKHGKERFFSEDGKLIGEGEYNFGTKTGRHWKVHLNGKNAYLALYDDKGTLLQPIVEFYDNGQKSMEDFVNGDVKDKAYKEWYENGQIKIDYNYLNGQFEGDQKEYYASGQVKLMTIYKDGLKKENIKSGMKMDPLISVEMKMEKKAENVLVVS